MITHSRIHGCGVLPANNHEHGIYVDDAIGTRIEWNLIYDNADRAIQLYPNSQGATIDHDVIDDNGEGIIFSGDNGMASSNNDVYNNLMTGARIRYDAESVVHRTATRSARVTRCTTTVCGAAERA